MKTEFECKKGKISKDLFVSIGTFGLMLFCFLYYVFDREYFQTWMILAYGLLFIYFFFTTVMEYVVIKKKKNAIVLTQDTINIVFQQPIPWADIESMEYIIGHVNSLFEITLKERKKYKIRRTRIFRLTSKFKNVIKVNLDSLEGSPKQNFEAILEFKNSLS